MNKLTVTQDGELIDRLPEGYDSATSSLAVSLARAEVDQQIATARAMPRSIDKAVKSITTLATLDDKSAEECVYALPRGGKPIKGPSIRLAEIIASQWGNCRVGARVVHVDRAEKFVEAEGVFHDLESNTATTARVRRRIVDKGGRLYNDDMIVVTGNAACSIAKRNAILGAVPKAVWRKAYESVERVIAGDVKTLVERRATAMKAFAAFGVKPEQIFQALGVAGMDDIGVDHIATLVAMHSTLKNGEETVETMFAKEQAMTPPPAPNTKAAVAPVAQGGESKPSESNESPPDFSAADAYEQGRDARKQGRALRAVPPEWRDNPAFTPLADAWQEGWRAADEEKAA